MPLSEWLEDHSSSSGSHTLSYTSLYPDLKLDLRVWTRSSQSSALSFEIGPFSPTISLL